MQIRMILTVCSVITLYALGEKCGGNFRYTERGNEDYQTVYASHIKLEKLYGYVCRKNTELADMMKRQRKVSTK